MATSIVFCLLLIAVVGTIVLPHVTHAFSVGFVNQDNYNSYQPAGFFSGVWHGLIAPWSLLVRILSIFSNTFDFGMYAYANTGWFYDFGFLIGILFSIPVGWIPAIIAFIAIFV